MVIVAGPNGSGKSTTTAQFSKDGYEVIDPDRIARNLSPNSPEDYSVAAGRQAINRARENILQGNSFLVETTLSSKGVYQRLVDSAKQKGFSVKLAYISTEDPQINIARVADRVSKGGHNVPDEDVVRRYYRSLDNLGEFFDKADDKAIIDKSSDFLESGSKGRLQLEIDSNGDTAFMADKDDDYSGRNVALFNRLRYWAYGALGNYKGITSESMWHDAVLSQALSLGTIEVDFNYNEIKNTAKSVAKWVWKHYTANHKNKGAMNLKALDIPLEAKQRLAARRTHELRSNATEGRIKAAIKDLTQDNALPSKSAVAKRVGLSRQQISRRYGHLFSLPTQEAQINDKKCHLRYTSDNSPDREVSSVKRDPYKRDNKKSAFGATFYNTGREIRHLPGGDISSLRQMRAITLPVFHPRSRVSQDSIFSVAQQRQIFPL